MASPETRQAFLLRVTFKLVLLTAGTLLALAVLVYGASLWSPGRSFLVLLVFSAGLVGGFVSIQQRLPRIGETELRELSTSWTSVLLIPLNGGIFAVVLHLAFLGQILQGSLFPHYVAEPTAGLKVVDAFKSWLVNIAPETPADLGKLIFWSFVAGFSERFVPQVIRQTSQTGLSEKS